MTALIELRVVPDSRAFIEAGAIAGLITSSGGRADTVGTPDKPVRLIIRGGQTLDVYGESVAQILLRAAIVRQEVREKGLDIKCDMLDPPHHDELGSEQPVPAQ